MYCTHGNKLMRTTTSCHTVAFVFHGYIPEISSISIMKIEDWVLLGINDFFFFCRQEIPVERSDGTTFCLTYVSLKPYFQWGLWARNLNNTQQDAPEIQESAQTYGRVGVSDTYIWHVLRNSSIGKQKK